MKHFVRRKLRKINFYARGVANYATPGIVHRACSPDVMRSVDRYDRAELADRVDYYLKGDGPIELSDQAIRLRQLTFEHSFYTFDLRRILCRLPTSFRFDYLFGDIMHVPESHSFVKSRPIQDDNEESVLLKLNQFRHYVRICDKLPFREKKDIAVWRGRGSQPHRVAFVTEFYDHPLCDVGKVDAQDAYPSSDMVKPLMTIPEHLQHKFLLSIEGNDVATNLKWIFQSNSLCLMSKPKYETWFMEGRLEPYVHYVPLKEDYSDLERQIRYYMDHPDEAEAIILNAQKYAKNFFDEPKERLLLLLVALKYAYRTGQYEGPLPLDW